MNDRVKSSIIDMSSDIKFQISRAATSSSLPFVIRLAVAYLIVVIKATARNKMELEYDLYCALPTINLLLTSC